jgi:hypothetical protein
MSAEFLSAALELVSAPGLAPLGPGPRPEVTDQPSLNAQLDELFKRHRPQNTDLIRSLILLWHDHLDASHDISQSEYNPDGSLIHAIMHRREPDYSNAKYWWRSTGDHPCFPNLAAAVEPLLNDDPELADQIISGGDWDPNAFTDAVSRGIREPQDSARHQLLRQLQKVETEIMLSHLAG